MIKSLLFTSIVLISLTWTCLAKGVPHVHVEEPHPYTITFFQVPQGLTESATVKQRKEVKEQDKQNAAKKADTPLGPQVPQNPLIQKPGPIATSQQANADQQPLNANQNTAKVQEPVKTEAQSQPAQLAAQANKVDKPQTSGQPSPLTAQTGQAEKLQAQNQLLPQVKASSNEAAVPAVTGGQQLGKVGDQSAVPKKQGSKTQVQAQNPAPQAQNLLKQSQTSNSAADSPQSGNALAKASKSPLGEQGNNIAQSPQTVNSAAGSPDLGKAPAKLQPSAPQVGAQGNIPAQPQAGNSKETASQPQPKKLTPEERKKVIANFVPLFKPSNHKDHALSFQKGAIKHPKHTMYPECHKCPENSSYAACVKSQTLKKCNEGLNNICYTKSVKDNDAIKYEMGCADHNMCLGARAFPCRDGSERCFTCCQWDRCNSNPHGGEYELDSINLDELQRSSGRTISFENSFTLLLCFLLQAGIIYLFC